MPPRRPRSMASIGLPCTDRPITNRSAGGSTPGAFDVVVVDDEIGAWVAAEVVGAVGGALDGMVTTRSLVGAAEAGTDAVGAGERTEPGAPDD